MKKHWRRYRVRVKCRTCRRAEVIPAGRWMWCRLKRTEPPCAKCGDDMRFVKTVY